MAADRGVAVPGAALVVTGAAGFLGTALVRHLLAGGVPVVGIDRRHQRTRDGLTALRADLLDRDPATRTDVDAALARARAVIHLAGRPGVRGRDPGIQRHRHRDNVLATARVLDAVPTGTPLVVASSSSVYGGSRFGRPCHETDPLAPRGGYARSKVAVEHLCRERIRCGARVVVARPFTVIGEGQRPDMALARWLAAARTGADVTVLGGLTRARDLTDVRDAAAALALLAEAGEPGPVNLGTGIPHTLEEMVRAVERVVGRRLRLRVLPAHPDEVRATLADPTRLERLTGLRPRTDLLAAVRRQAQTSEMPLGSRESLACGVPA